ncbi:MAG: ABC transporter permease subunit [Lachnospiraceae bacterium]|jgi:ABC-type Na+ efflux pump permease subunit|nr:ABC transporter permease subunit [Lachnospiraceae bacterium]
MNHSTLVLQIQLARFKREKGMLIFYGLTIVIVGIIVPMAMGGMGSSLTMAALLTTTFLKPLLSDSVAGERDHRTLEPLLSSPMSGKSIVWGKARFCLCFAIVFFGLIVLCATLTNWLRGSAGQSGLIGLTGNEGTMAVWQWMGILLMALFNFGAIALSGVYLSATSADMRTANSRVSRAAYPMGMIFLIYTAVIVLVDRTTAALMGMTLIFIYLCIILFFAIKLSTMKQSDYYENIKSKAVRATHQNHLVMGTPKSSFGTVFCFELKYLLTLKLMLLNFAGMCATPALIACVLPQYTGVFDLNYAVFTTILLIPRVPTNLIAYSIGGEKVYKTGESLLATPLPARSIVLAKCMVPLLVSTVMLAVSALITLLVVTVYGWIRPEFILVDHYTIGQLVLLFPVGIMSSMLMIALSAIASVLMKTPRHGLYVTSIISILFVLPVVAIVYGTTDHLRWSLIYLAVLLIGNAICIKGILGRTTRPQIMRYL